MKKIVIDAGHGGTDGGATSNGLIEKNLTLDISNNMANKLRQLGVEVYQTRTTDETLSPQERVNRIMNAFGNNEDVIVVSNHINAGGGNGAEVIYALRNTSDLSNLILDELSRSGQNIRKAYQRRLPSNPSKDYYFIHRDTGVTEPVIVEYGFIDSTGDDVDLLKNKREELVDAVVRALATYINIPYLKSDTYIVQKGDSLYSIARKYNINVNDLINLNNLSSNILSIGQTLQIPKKEELQEYKVYTVKKGDSLYKIANDNNVTVNKLIDYNNLDSTVLKENQVILIPIIEQESINEDYITYTVERNDTLFSISRKYNTTVDKIKELNNLQTNILSIGQVLKIPTPQEEKDTSSYIEYVVNPKDTLYKISKEYNIDIEKLLDYNSLDSTILSIGQIIRIPITTNDKIYVVKSGDTLYKISKENNIPIQEIINKNNLTSTVLSIGQKIIL